MSERATFCSPGQAGMLLTSSTYGAPAGRGACRRRQKSAPTARAAATARHRGPCRRNERLAAVPPCLTFVIQCRRAAPWRRRRGRRRRSTRKSRKPSPPSTPTEALQVIDALQPRRAAGRSSRRPDQRKAAPLRAEQRLQDQRPARALALDDSAAPACGFRPPRWRAVGTPARCSRKLVMRLVDAALDGAGIVPDRHAKFAQRMQHAEPQRHRLEGAARTPCARARPSGRRAAETGDRPGRTGFVVSKPQSVRRTMRTCAPSAARRLWRAAAPAARACWRRRAMRGPWRGDDPEPRPCQPNEACSFARSTRRRGSLRRARSPSPRPRPG